MQEKSSIIQALDTLGKEAFEHLQNTEDPVQKAFYLGIMNVCGSFCEAEEVSENEFCATISLDYDDVKAGFEKAMQNMNTSKKPKETSEQLTLEQLFPKVFEEFDKRLEKMEKLLKKQKKE